MAEQKEKVVGVYKPTAAEIRFNKVWGDHTFTDEEIEKLLDGETISFQSVSKKGQPYVATGKLSEQTFERDGNSYKFWGFSLATDSVPATWAGHTFTKEEIETLSSGGTVYVQDCVSKAGKKFSCNLSWGEEDGRKKLIPNFGGNK